MWGGGESAVFGGRRRNITSGDENGDEDGDENMVCVSLCIEGYKMSFY